MSFRRFIEKADRAGYLVTIDRPVAATFELANVAHALEGRPVLFNHVAGYPGWRVCAGPCSDRAYFSLDLDVAAPDLVGRAVRTVPRPTGEGAGLKSARVVVGAGRIVFDINRNRPAQLD